jgi:CHASE3 domain sensor protein
MKIRTLAQKIGLGYTAMVAVLAVAVVLTIWQIGELRQIAVRLIELREPTSKAGLEKKTLQPNPPFGYGVTEDGN